MSARRRGSTPATTPISGPTARSPTARWSAATAGPSRRSPRPATPPTTWPSPSRRPNLLFSGDHVMAWSTPVVAPPDGAMSDYMASLDKLARRTEPIYLPGPRRRRAQRAALRRGTTSAHRKAREASILHRLGKGAADIPTWCGRSISGSIRGWCRRAGLLGAGASRGSGGARRGRDRRPAVDRRASTAWR